MTLWIDAQLSPALAVWLRATFELDAWPVRELKLRDASDEAIFESARQAGAIVMTFEPIAEWVIDARDAEDFLTRLRTPAP